MTESLKKHQNQDTKTSKNSKHVMEEETGRPKKACKIVSPYEKESNDKA